MKNESMLIRKLLFVFGVFSNLTVAQTAIAFQFDYPVFRHGRNIWLASCSTCSVNVLSNAPQSKNQTAWIPSMTKGREVLISGSLKCFRDEYEDMPPRGGNTNPNEAGVKAELKYMLTTVLNETGETYDT